MRRAQTLSYFLLLAALCGDLSRHGSEARRCAEEFVQPLMRQCDPHLVAVQTAVLMHTAAVNFSLLCRTFEHYVTCMDSRLHGCEAPALHGYVRNRIIYTADPYNCTASDDVTSGINIRGPPDERKLEAGDAASQQHFHTSSAGELLPVSFLPTVLLSILLTVLPSVLLLASGVLAVHNRGSQC